jgi:hypothetical protein
LLDEEPVSTYASAIFSLFTPRYSPMPTLSEHRFSEYRRKTVSEMRPYIVGEDMTGISISPEDRKNGDMIARNPLNHKDQWLVAKKYFEENFVQLLQAGKDAKSSSASK